MRITLRRAVAATAAVAAATAGTLATAAAASTADTVQNLPAFKAACNAQQPAGQRFTSWQQTPVTRGAAGTAVYAVIVVGTFDSGYDKQRCLGILPTGRTAGKEYELSVTALRTDSTPDIAAAASGTSSQPFVKVAGTIVQDGEDELSDHLVAVGAASSWRLTSPAASSVRILL